MRALILLALLMTAFAGCVEDDTIRIAFVTKDTALEPHEDPERLADFVAKHTGRDVEVFTFTSANAALEAVRVGQADFASVDGTAAWLAWQKLGLEVIASEVRGDGRTHYMASAWTRNDTGIESVDDFADRTSCHTGATKSAGMFMPMSYLIQEGYVDATGKTEVSQVQDLARAFFDEPVIGGAYEGYEGALRCLSTGVGDLAFIRDTTPADYCAEPGDRTWCLDLAAYHKVIDFGPVPEHAIMVGPHVNTATEADILAALLALNDSDDGRDILDGVFGTHGIAKVGTEEHLGDFGGLIANLPGIEAYAGSQ